VEGGSSDSAYYARDSENSASESARGSISQNGAV
jgi:hypothetical protein